MATSAQIHANQINSQSSRGPKTAEGKSAVSQNARTHGLSSKIVPLSEAERPDFEALESTLRQELRPNGALEEIVFRDLLTASWKKEILRRLLNDTMTSSTAAFDDQTSDRTRRLERHQTDQTRTFNRALAQLKQLQHNRAVNLAAEKLHNATNTISRLVNFPKVHRDFQSMFPQSGPHKTKPIATPDAAAAATQTASHPPQH